MKRRKKGGGKESGGEKEGEKEEGGKSRVKNNYVGQLVKQPNTLKFGWPYSTFGWP